MYEIKDLQRTFGLTWRQTNFRLDLLLHLLNGHLQRGKNNRKLLDGYGFELFKRLVEVERDRQLSVEAAVRVLESELEKPGGNGDRATVEVGRRDALIAALEARIAEQAKVIQWQQEELSHALAQVEDLRHRALPPPRRRWWPWAWSRIRRGAENC